jgi:hypothetical protein
MPLSIKILKALKVLKVLNLDPPKKEETEDVQGAHAQGAHARGSRLMTVPEALEIVCRVGAVWVENGRIKTQFSGGERARLQPVIDFLREHREETLRLLAKPPVSDSPAPAPSQSQDSGDAPNTETASPIEEPAPPEPETPEKDDPEPTSLALQPDPTPALADIDPDAEGVPYTQWKAYQLEQLISEGDHEAHNADLPLEARCRGLLKIIEAHFWRSYKAWEFQRRARPGMREHGNWPEFISSWLWANSYRTDRPFQGLAPVCEALRKEYPAPGRPMIGEGRTYWGTGNNHQHRNKYNSPPAPGKNGADHPSADKATECR